MCVFPPALLFAPMVASTMPRRSRAFNPSEVTAVHRLWDPGTGSLRFDTLPQEASLGAPGSCPSTVTSFEEGSPTKIDHRKKGCLYSTQKPTNSPYFSVWLLVIALFPSFAFQVLKGTCPILSLLVVSLLRKLAAGPLPEVSTVVRSRAFAFLFFSQSCLFGHGSSPMPPFWGGRTPMDHRC